LADTIRVDLAELKRVLNDGLSFRPNGFEGCFPEIGISTEDLAALLESTESSSHSSLVPQALQKNDIGTV
jgi:hypothetical protein